jgi:predicted ATPase
MSLPRIEPSQRARLIVLTGGPGAGKTAVLETVRREFPERVELVPEAAGMLFQGGFPRRSDDLGRAAAQRAIFHVQRELEGLALAAGEGVPVLCDRGSLDALAYWPHHPDTFFEQMQTTRERELARYHAVLHLRTPTHALGYDLSNPIRLETAEQALQLDRRIEDAWLGHPHRHFIDSHDDFLDKLMLALRLLQLEMAARCTGPDRTAQT